MNKVIIINLNGIAYQLEESGYDALREYLDTAARRLGNNPDRDEIIADIEQAIGDKFRAVLGANKTVVITKEVMAVIIEMGMVEDASGEEGAAGADNPSAKRAAPGPERAAAEPPPVRRLYRIQDGAMISGVCNGIGAYFNIDATFVRLGFIILTLFWGAGVLVYLFMSFLVPMANTPAEKAAAIGVAATAQEFIRRAKAGYYEGMKTFHDKQAHREWKRRYKQEMRSWKRNFQHSMQEGARSMQESAHHWQKHWGEHPPSIFGAVFVAPILSIMLLGLVLGLFYALYSLVVHGGVFGWLLPVGIPLWVGIVVLILAYHFISWPIKAARHDCYRGGPWGHGYWSPGPLAGIVWLGILVVSVWWVDHSSPEFHAWLQTVPGHLQHAADAVRDWWHNK